MKPNEPVYDVSNPVIYNLAGENIQVKTEATESSPASEALQLIFQDSGLDSKSIMFDLTKLLNEDPNLSAQLGGSQRMIVTAPSAHAMEIPKRSAMNTFIIEGMDQDDCGAQYALSSSSVGASSSYGASPLAGGYVVVKQEPENIGFAFSGGGNSSSAISPGAPQAAYHSLQNAGPTLAQLNSPPNDDLMSLRTFGDLDSLGLDLEALTGDLLAGYPVEVKTEYIPIASGQPWYTRPSSLSTSVPTPVISHSDYHDLSNLSNGGPALSPSRLTLSPPARGGLSPQYQRPTLSPTMIPATVPTSPPHTSTLHELLMRGSQSNVPDPIRSRSNSNQFKSAKRQIGGRQRSSLSISNPLLASQLSKSAPVKPLDPAVWGRREPRLHQASICSIGDQSSIADEVSEVLNSLSPSELNDIDSEDEEDEDIKERDGDDSDDDLEIDEEENGGGSKKERYFWQYNVQAKGPKGQKLALDTTIHDPHKLNDIIDPVFSDNVSVHGIKHSGKARRGDGNDLTANPKKLAAIGKELDKLGKEINAMTPVSEVPFPTRTKSRKEKNKLASRACRLKKKAQHEANKLKLHGLEEEHNDLMKSMVAVKRILGAKWGGGQGETGSQERLTLEAERILKLTQKNRVSGQTTDYVNRMIVKNGGEGLVN